MNLLSIALFSMLAVSPILAESTHGTSTVEIAGLRFSVPKNWVDAKPLSPMRAAQWSLPAPKMADPAGEVVAFYFGPDQGGDTKSNIERWTSTMTTPDGAPAQGDVTVRKVGVFNVIQLLISGTYTNSMATPGIPAPAHPGWGLIGAVVEGPSGNIFFRFTGPDALVKANLVAFTRFIDSLKPAS